MKKVSKNKIIKHLKGDIKTFKHESHEDTELIRDLKMAKKKSVPKKKHDLKPNNFIAGAIKHPGALRKELHIKKGEAIPKKKLKSAEKKGGLIGKRARLAETLKKLSKKKKHK